MDAALVTRKLAVIKARLGAPCFFSIIPGYYWPVLCTVHVPGARFFISTTGLAVEPFFDEWPAPLIVGIARRRGAKRSEAAFRPASASARCPSRVA